MVSLKEESVCVKMNETEFPRLFLSLIKSYDMNSMLILKIFNIFSDVSKDEVPSFVEAVIESVIIILVHREM